jgi:hypothetical protein
VDRADLKKLEQRALDSEACEIFLQTARSSKTTQALYEKLGYVRDDTFLVYTFEINGLVGIL